MKPIVIVGPTASGKTELSFQLARTFQGEIISADSRQIYKYLNAGTAKPPGQWVPTSSGEEYLSDAIPVHLVDFLDPNHSFNVGEYRRLSQSASEKIKARNKRLIMCGGTGLYIQAFWNGMDPLPLGNPAFRQKLEQAARENGTEKLHRKLVRVDPEAASKIHPRNIQRLIRALEVYELSGKPISSYWSKNIFK
ncbi:MAG: tRNA (adenosine(37)-N6)-dimethylallyltransferase MiaA, partial [Elusimicrobia bacterium]|nr:tRNA (adenosine(37)-N6)-dimethylallyltransferase MiaA [Elusimicrobiota bacterium]